MDNDCGAGTDAWGWTDAVLFDFDMTLADTSEIINICTNRLADRFGLRRVSMSETMATIGITLAESWIRYWGRFEQEWLDCYRGEIGVDEEKGMKPFPGAREAVGSLRAAGVRTAVVTNRHLARRAVSWAGMGDLFDTVVGLEDGVKPKPDAEPIELALSRLGAVPWRAIYAGDTELDMASAAAAGVRGVGLTTGNLGARELLAAGAFAVCDSVEELARRVLAGRR